MRSVACHPIIQRVPASGYVPAYRRSVAGCGALSRATGSPAHCRSHSQARRGGAIRGCWFRGHGGNGAAHQGPLRHSGVPRMQLSGQHPIERPPSGGGMSPRISAVRPLRALGSSCIVPPHAARSSTGELIVPHHQVDNGPHRTSRRHIASGGTREAYLTKRYLFSEQSSFPRVFPSFDGNSSTTLHPVAATTAFRWRSRSYGSYATTRDLLATSTISLL